MKVQRCLLPVQIVVRYLFASKVTEFSFVNSWIRTIEVDSDRKLQERIANCFKSLQVEKVIRIRHGDCLKYGTGAWSNERLNINIVVKFNIGFWND